ncbi:MAG: DUF3841 domain-containing protein [Oscillospiraceae bacterium]|nr:DUF3841 domain-containing protein [Oscillospiraceae bacterium]
MDSRSEILRLWTCQSPEVSLLLAHDGVCRVRREFIDRKYAEAAWSFRRAYAFFSRYMTAVLPPEEGEESPYWLYADGRAAGSSGQGVLMELAVPGDQCLCFDGQSWNRVLNLEYLEKDAEDAAAFRRRLEAAGLQHPSQAFSLPFYPQFRREIESSWERLFLREPAEKGMQAAVWHLKEEWVVARHRL